jgi:hypothetical protein
VAFLLVLSFRLVRLRRGFPSRKLSGFTSPLERGVGVCAKEGKKKGRIAFQLPAKDFNTEYFIKEKKHERVQSIPMGKDRVCSGI